MKNYIKVMREKYRWYCFRIFRRIFKKWTSNCGLNNRQNEEYI